MRRLNAHLASAPIKRPSSPLTYSHLFSSSFLLPPPSLSLTPSLFLANFPPPTPTPSGDLGSGASCLSDQEKGDVAAFEVTVLAGVGAGLGLVIPVLAAGLLLEKHHNWERLSFSARGESGSTRRRSSRRKTVSGTLRGAETVLESKARKGWLKLSVLSKMPGMFRPVRLSQSSPEPAEVSSEIMRSVGLLPTTRDV